MATRQLQSPTCKLYMLVGDVNSDHYMDAENEYIDWLNKMTLPTPAFTTSTFATLPSQLQALYTKYATTFSTNGQIDINSARPGTQPTTPEQGASLDALCTEVAALLPQLTAASSTAPGVATTTVTPSVGGSTPVPGSVGTAAPTGGTAAPIVSTVPGTTAAPIGTAAPTATVVPLAAVVHNGTAIPSGTVVPSATAFPIATAAPGGLTSAPGGTGNVTGTTMDYSHCKREMSVSDGDRNFMLNQLEYISLVNKLSNNAFISYTTVTALPPSLSQNYYTLAQGGEIEIVGAIPPFAQNQQVLDSICHATGQAIYQAVHGTTGNIFSYSNSTASVPPSSLPSASTLPPTSIGPATVGNASTAPLPTAAVFRPQDAHPQLTIQSSFVTSIIVPPGTNAGNLPEATRNLLLAGYAAFVQTAVPAMIKQSKVAHHSAGTNTTIPNVVGNATTGNTSLTGTPTPIGITPAPLPGSVPPVSGNVSLNASTAAPYPGTAAPFPGTAAPNLTVIASTSAPFPGTAAPYPGTAAPLTGNLTANASTTTPSPGTAAPLIGTGYPGANVSGTASPYPATGAPLPGTSYPITATTAPVAPLARKLFLRRRVQATIAPSTLGTVAASGGTAPPTSATVSPVGNTSAPLPGTAAPLPGNATLTGATAAPLPGTAYPTGVTAAPFPATSNATAPPVNATSVNATTPVGGIAPTGATLPTGTTTPTLGPDTIMTTGPPNSSLVQGSARILQVTDSAECPPSNNTVTSRACLAVVGSYEVEVAAGQSREVLHDSLIAQTQSAIGTGQLQAAMDTAAPTAGAKVLVSDATSPPTAAQAEEGGGGNTFAMVGAAAIGVVFLAAVGAGGYLAYKKGYFGGGDGDESTAAEDRNEKLSKDVNTADDQFEDEVDENDTGRSGRIR